MASISNIIRIRNLSGTTAADGLMVPVDFAGWNQAKTITVGDLRQLIVSGGTDGTSGSSGN